MHFSNKVRYFLCALLIAISTYTAQAQREKVLSAEDQKLVKKDAGGAFAAGDYMSAMADYERLLKADPNNSDYNYKVGVCYLLTYIDPTQAVKYLEVVVPDKNTPKEYQYYFGQAYHYVNRFDEAISAYQTYREANPGKNAAFSDVSRKIEMCQNGKDLVARPVTVQFENLGKLVNSDSREMNPIISADESMLVFTARRKGNLGGLVDDQGMNTSDVFMSGLEEGQRTKAKNMGVSINTAFDDFATGLTPNGDRLITYGNNNQKTGDLYVATMGSRSFGKAVALNEAVNTAADETSGCLSPDGMMLYFASDNKGGKGGRDLYMARKLPSGNFGVPVNLGDNINTSDDEDNPFISADGKTLYFVSKGHDSMGGFDIFKSTDNEGNGNWSKCQNMGFPVNTAADNMSFSITADGRYGFVDRLRPEGLGDLDIYRLVFNNVQSAKPVAIYKGAINNPYEDKPLNAKITLKEKGENGKTIGIYTPNPSTSKFVMIMEKGHYTFTIDCPGFIQYSEEITIPELKSNMEIAKNIIISFDQDTQQGGGGN